MGKYEKEPAEVLVLKNTRKVHWIGLTGYYTLFKKKKCGEFEHTARKAIQAEAQREDWGKQKEWGLSDAGTIFKSLTFAFGAQRGRKEGKGRKSV